MSRLRDLLDTTPPVFGDNRKVLRYDSSQDKFILTNIKEKLSLASQDDDLDDRFIEVIEPHIDVETTEDYGTF